MHGAFKCSNLWLGRDANGDMCTVTEEVKEFRFSLMTRLVTLHKQKVKIALQTSRLNREGIISRHTKCPSKDCEISPKQLRKSV